jgi:hypothetical protein
MQNTHIESESYIFTLHNIRSQLFSPVVPSLNNPIIPSLTPTIPLEYHYPSRLVCHSLLSIRLSLNTTHLSVRPKKDRLHHFLTRTPLSMRPNRARRTVDYIISSLLPLIVWGLTKVSLYIQHNISYSLDLQNSTTLMLWPSSDPCPCVQQLSAHF